MSYFILRLNAQAYTQVSIHCRQHHLRTITPSSHCLHPVQSPPCLAITEGDELKPKLVMKPLPFFLKWFFHHKAEPAALLMVSGFRGSVSKVKLTSQLPTSPLFSTPPYTARRLQIMVLQFLSLLRMELQHPTIRRPSGQAKWTLKTKPHLIALTRNLCPIALLFATISFHCTGRRGLYEWICTKLLFTVVYLGGNYPELEFCALCLWWFCAES